MKKFAIGFALVLMSSAALSRADETCVITKGGDEPVIYAVKISDRVLPHRAGDPADVSPMEATKDLQILQGDSPIGHFSKSSTEIVGDEGTVSVTVTIAGQERLNIFIDGRNCTTDGSIAMCPATWTQPGLGLKNAGAVCVSKN